MTHLIKFEPKHALALKDHGGQEALLAHANEADLDHLAGAGLAYSVVDVDRIIACGGFVHCNRFRAVAWGLLQTDTPRTFFSIHRHVTRVMAEQPYAVIATYVKPSFGQAMRWAPMLGFRLVRPYLPFWFPDGSGASEWVHYPRPGGHVAASHDGD